jgi:hypothetical protein
MNVILNGAVKNILNNMISSGYANTQSEAIRLAIISFGKENLSKIDAINTKLDRIDKDIANGKRKELNEEEALGKFTKHVK